MSSSDAVKTSGSQPCWDEERPPGHHPPGATTPTTGLRRAAPPPPSTQNPWEGAEHRRVPGRARTALCVEAGGVELWVPRGHSLPARLRSTMRWISWAWTDISTRDGWIHGCQASQTETVSIQVAQPPRRRLARGPEDLFRSWTARQFSGPLLSSLPPQLPTFRPPKAPGHRVQVATQSSRGPTLSRQPSSSCLSLCPQLTTPKPCPVLRP